MPAEGALPIRGECPVCSNRNLSRHDENRLLCKACGAIFSRRPRACVICGAAIPHGRRSNTCCEEHRKLRVRDEQLRYYHQRMTDDPLFNRKKRDKYKQNPGYQAVMRNQEERKWQRIKSDPERLERSQERQRQHYAAHAAEIQERRREALKLLTPEQLVRKREAIRAGMRKHAAKIRAMRKADPAAYEKYRKWQYDYRRRMALARLMAVGAELERRLKESGGSGE